MYFIYAIKDDVKNNILRILIFILMLFNPISYAEMTFQRIYRNGIGIFQTIFIFSGIYIIFKNRNKDLKKLIPHIILVSINIVFLWHAREDSIWVLPFMIAALMVTCLFIIFENNKKILLCSLKKHIIKIIIILMPIWILLFSSIFVKTMNFHYYGVFVEREADSNFGKVISLFYKVKSNEQIQYVDITREKINRMYEVSESLNSIKPELEESLDIWTKYDRNPQDNEVENGWFAWCLKDAVSNAGKYSSAKESNEFYGKICDEINLAIKNGKLEENKNMLLSSLAPLRDEYISEFFKQFKIYINYIFKFDDLRTSNDISEEGGGVADLKVSDFEFVTSNNAISKNSTNVRICGWYFLNNREDFKLYLTNEKGERISEITRGESTDLKSGFNLNPEFNYRFDFIINDIEKNNSYEELFIEATNLNDEIIQKISLLDYTPNIIIEGKDSTYSISMISIDKRVDPNQTFSNGSVHILNNMKNIYSRISTALVYIAFIMYIVIGFVSIFKFIKNKKKTEEFDVFLILTGILLSFIVVLTGIIYTGLSFCNTLIYMYLAVAYPLFMMFVSLSISYFINRTFQKCKYML